MRKNKIYLNKIISFLGNSLLKIHGVYDSIYIDNLSSSEKINETSLDWVNPNKQDKQEIVESSKARVILVDNQITYSENLKKENKVLLVVRNPKLQLAKIGNEFFIENIKEYIHPSALVNGKAKIGKGVYIGPYSLIEECEIGDNCYIDSNVKIHKGTKLGKHCIIKSGAVLGGEGFGFERDEKGNLFKFPQLGDLIIENYVEIGANTCIDRGSLDDTKIGDYTKINNLCHIAHNNKIGKNVVITAHVNISGSNTIEDNVWISPNSSIIGWVNIGKSAIVGMGSVVTKNIPSDETWIGCPAKKMK